jgi:signal transduction histidine kinase
MDVVWLLFLAGLAVLQPIGEIDKQLVLLAIGVVQLLERRLIAFLPGAGPAYSVLAKILLATLLMLHTSTVGINSSYYPIYYLPVVTAAVYFGPWATLLWTALASGAYCSLLVPALRDYELTASGISELAIRILFLFLAGILVNRFAIENRRHALRYQRLAETLAETNVRLARAEAGARRSERLAALGQLSAGLAHEIRNPLGIIKGSAEILNQKLRDATPLASELAANISGEVNRLSGLVARFLDFARPSRMETRPQQIAPVVDRALKAVRDQYPDAKVTVERDYAAELPTLMLDEELCEQVFINLGLNAYEAMGAEGRLCVRIVSATTNGRRGVEVTWRDSGPGIPPELRESIFNPFVTTKPSGAGLGLSIVSKIVDDHRGAIRLASEPGKGADFRVFLPAEE